MNNRGLTINMPGNVNGLSMGVPSNIYHSSGINSGMTLMSPVNSLSMSPVNGFSMGVSPQMLHSRGIPAGMALMSPGKEIEHRIEYNPYGMQNPQTITTRNNGVIHPTMGHNIVNDQGTPIMMSPSKPGQWEPIGARFDYGNFNENKDPINISMPGNYGLGIGNMGMNPFRSKIIVRDAGLDGIELPKDPAKLNELIIRLREILKKDGIVSNDPLVKELSLNLTSPLGPSGLSVVQNSIKDIVKTERFDEAGVENKENNASWSWDDSHKMIKRSVDGETRHYSGSSVIVIESAYHNGIEINNAIVVFGKEKHNGLFRQEVRYDVRGYITEKVADTVNKRTLAENAIRSLKKESCGYIDIDQSNLKAYVDICKNTENVFYRVYIIVVPGARINDDEHREFIKQIGTSVSTPAGCENNNLNRINIKSLGKALLNLTDTRLNDADGRTITVSGRLLSALAPVLSGYYSKKSLFEYGFTNPVDAQIMLYNINGKQIKNIKA